FNDRFTFLEYRNEKLSSITSYRLIQSGELLSIPRNVATLMDIKRVLMRLISKCMLCYDRDSIVNALRTMYSFLNRYEIPVEDAAEMIYDTYSYCNSLGILFDPTAQQKASPSVTYHRKISRDEIRIHLQHERTRRRPVEEE